MLVDSLNLKCDLNNLNQCKINIDGSETDVVVFLNEKTANSSSVEDYDNLEMKPFTVTTLDRYQKLMDSNSFNFDADLQTLDEESLNSTDFVDNAENLVKIQIEYQNLTCIKTFAFSEAVNIQEIDLDHNQIIIIEDDVFVDLENLTFLSLSKNNLTNLRANIFAGAVNLQRLHLNQNKIETIESGALNLLQLEVILLQNNKLKTLSNAMFIGTPQLKEVILEENELTRINDAMSHLNHLRILVLDYNQIEDIRLEKLASLKELQHLSLRRSGIKFTSIADNQNSSSAANNSTLEVLDLAENEISNGNDIIRQLRFFNHLEIINLEFNELEYLDHVYDIKKYFPFLHILNLGFNQIQCKWIEDYGDFFKLREIKLIYDYCESID